MIEYQCPYCYTWQKKESFKQHMYDHAMGGDDLGTIKVPSTWQDFARRFAPLGLFQTRGTDDEY